MMIRQTKSNQKGATLVALLAIMTIMAITMLAVAPNILQTVQREKELESIRRGEEVANAIKEYVNALNKLPNSIDELLEGIPQGTKKRKILRQSASIDPLSDDGKWRLVKPNSDTLIQFTRRVQNYNGGVLPANPPNPSRIFDNAIMNLVNVVDTKSESDTKDADSSDEISDETENVQFIGVVSKSKSRSVIAYYGLENHSKWLFTPLFRGQGVSSVLPPNRNSVFGNKTPEAGVDEREDN